ncbi:MAG: hypothetical protein GWP70_01070, partial [Proteobacteria bacterium]|nr:hypothetical protein [Pseudomonadota bacterium]
PLLVNGDIVDAATARQALRASGAQGVMIGRAAMGQPWLFTELLGRPLPDFAQRLDLIDKHLQMMHAFYGSESGARIARKHMQAYLQRWGASQLTAEFMPLSNGAAQCQWFKQQRQRLLDMAHGQQSQSKEQAAA